MDVYSDWSGPCTGMVSILKKIKMEIGGDALSYATVITKNNIKRIIINLLILNIMQINKSNINNTQENTNIDYYICLNTII